MDTSIYLRVLSCHGILVEPFTFAKPTRLEAGESVLLEYPFDNSLPELECIPVLLANSAAFDVNVKGGSWTQGTRYNRYNSQGKHFDFFVRDDEIDPELNALMALLHKPEDLVKLIVDHHRRTVPLPWDNQEQYGKIHRTLELIKPIK